MAANYVLLEKITVGAAGASSVTFSGIPQTGYTDLVVKVSARNDASNVAGGVWLYPNGSSANMTGQILAGTGSVAVAGTDTKVYGYTNSANSTASTFGNIEFYIPNYTSSNNKSISVDSVMENNATEGRQGLMAGLWSITSAITSLEFQTFNNSTSAAANFVQGSTFYLYGVAKLGTTPAIVPYATGGDTIMTDGTYWYHTFISSGTFTPQKAISCDYLVVAGGGGGAGGSWSGGGGAGGYRTSIGGSALSLGTSAVTVTIGAGGSGGAGASGTQKGTNGSDSVFSSITSTGGGAGGAPTLTNTSGNNGGSGGGAGNTGLNENTPGSGNTPSTSPSQGNNGGGSTQTGAGNYAGGGGGGASAVGSSSTTSTNATGGAGTANSISGTSVTYAGGGGGGFGGGQSGTVAGGAGGGGTGAALVGGNGTANLGGGGGGGGNTSSVGYAGGAGGSGIVIVRYAV